MKIMELTWSDIEEMEKADKVLLYPLGAVEQHGKHLPLGVDTYMIENISTKVEELLAGKVLLLPTQWLGHSPHHLHFPGTTSVDHETHAESLIQSVDAFIQAGFKQVILLNGHGGNGLPMQMALQSLKNRYPDRTDASIYAFNYWNLVRQELANIRESPFGGMGHACEMETSVMMYLYPHLVRENMIRNDGQQPDSKYMQFDMLHGSPVNTQYNFEELSDTGVFGDPTLASAEKGKRFFEATVQGIVEFVKDVSA